MFQPLDERQAPDGHFKRNPVLREIGSCRRDEHAGAEVANNFLLVMSIVDSAPVQGLELAGVQPPAQTTKHSVNKQQQLQNP